MKIPKRFTLYGHTIEVEISNDLHYKEGEFGEALYRTGKIILQSDNIGLPVSQYEQTFCHELVHYILHFSGYYKLQSDEDFVERISELLHQALVTMEYE